MEFLSEWLEDIIKDIKRKKQKHNPISSQLGEKSYNFTNNKQKNFRPHSISNVKTRKKIGLNKQDFRFDRGISYNEDDV